MFDRVSGHPSRTAFFDAVGRRIVPPSIGDEIATASTDVPGNVLLPTYAGPDGEHVGQLRRETASFIDWSVDAGAPAEYYEDVTPAGALASFDASTTWVEHPYRDQVALIGDAAGATDPMWGQGLSLTMRDVRVLRDQLLSNKDWNKAGNAYAEEHDKYFTVSNTVQMWFERLMVETGPEADVRRELALPLWQEDATRRVDTLSSGPDHSIDEAVRRRFFGED